MKLERKEKKIKKERGENKTMEIKGKEEELEKHFKKMQVVKQKNILLHDYTDNQKRWFFIGVVFFALSLMVIFGITSLIESYNHKNYLTTTECYKKLDSYINYQEMSWYKIIIINMIPYMPLIVLGIVLGWIFHGVGFKFIG